MKTEELEVKALELLEAMIKTPSFSGNEEEVSLVLQNWLKNFGVKYFMSENNVWAYNQFFDASKPTVLLNSHMDTVKPNKGYTREPFSPKIMDGKLYGLGSNDAGGALVSLLSAFVCFYSRKNLKYNLVMAATAEEESSGPNGLNSLLTELPPIDFAIVMPRPEPFGLDVTMFTKRLSFIFSGFLNLYLLHELLCDFLTYLQL